MQPLGVGSNTGPPREPMEGQGNRRSNINEKRLMLHFLGTTLLAFSVNFISILSVSLWDKRISR